MDILMGDGCIREAIEAGANIEELEREWISELRGYQEKARACYLY